MFKTRKQRSEKIIRINIDKRDDNNEDNNKDRESAIIKNTR